MFSRLFSCYNASANANASVPVIKPNLNAIANTQKTIVWSDTLQFIPPVNTGQVIKVYDGYTITIAGEEEIEPVFTNIKENSFINENKYKIFNKK